MPGESPFSDAFGATLKRAAAALREDEVPYLLAGGIACWARGGPETEHDLDLMVRPEDADRTLQALERTGMRAERPPEGWLYKAWDGDVMIDVIFAPKGFEIDETVLARGEEMEILATPVRVMSLEDVLVSKLLVLSEPELDYSSVLEIARSLREQIDWSDVRARTGQSPFAKAFFTLVEELGIVERAASWQG